MKNDDGPLPAEDVRLGYPELTRCDHCGVLDPTTMRVGIEGELYWLHRDCMDAFEPIDSRPVTLGKRVVGFATKYPGQPGWIAWRLCGGRLVNRQDGLHDDGQVEVCAHRGFYARIMRAIPRTLSRV
jgi:hypothetical protein